MVKYELFSRQPQQNGPSQPQQPGVLENLRKIILQKQNTKNLLQIPSSRITFLLSLKAFTFIPLPTDSRVEVIWNCQWRRSQDLAILETPLQWRSYYLPQRRSFGPRERDILDVSQTTLKWVITKSWVLDWDRGRILQAVFVSTWRGPYLPPIDCPKESLLVVLSLIFKCKQISKQSNTTTNTFKLIWDWPYLTTTKPRKITR